MRKNNNYLVVVLMGIQVGLFIVGVWQLFTNQVAFGLFNIFMNSIFFAVNVNTLKSQNK